MVREVLHHTHVLQIIEDHQYLWLCADTSEDKQQVVVRYRRQMALVLVNFLGWEATLHGVGLTAFGSPMYGGTLLLIGALICRITGKGN